MAIIAPQLFPFLRVFNFFIDFFSIFPRLCRCWLPAVLRPQTCNDFVVSLINLRAVIFRLSGSRGGFAPYAPGRPSTRRRRACRPFGIYKRHVGPNVSDGSALDAWLFYDLGCETVYRSSRNTFRLFRSFFVLDFLYTAAAASRCLSTERLLERLRFPLSREAGDLYVL